MNKKKIISGSIITFVFLCLIIGMKFYKEHQTIQIPYQEFNRMLSQEEVEKVNLNESETMTFSRKEDTQFYETQNPRKENLKEVLLLKGIEVTETSAYTSFYRIQYLISAILFGGVFYIVFKSAKKQKGGAMALETKPIEPTNLKVGFSQIAGNEEAKDQVQDTIDFIKCPEKYTKLGARMPKGIIFYGPSGTGKTLMAKAIAKEANVPFFAVSGSDFVQLYVGVGASRIREIFKQAREHAKAVIFIDEIDAIGKKRGNSLTNSNDEKDQTLNALLTEMSGFKPEDGIVVIAATNRLDLLDDALLRPGRFDRHIQIGYPDIKAREQILRLYLKDKPVADDVKVESLAKQTVYFTGAMLENLLNEAAIIAANQEASFITKEAIQKAFYIVIAGPEKKDRSMIALKDRQITAFHEAGHALITKLLAPENSVTKVTIIPSTKGAGGFSMNVPRDKMYLTKQDILTQIQISLAGRAAEEIIFGEACITTGASNDIEKATLQLKEYISQYGMDKEIGLINLKVLVGENGISDKSFVEKCSLKMEELYKMVKEELTQHTLELEKIAQELLKKETLEEEALDELLSA